MKLAARKHVGWFRPGALAVVAVVAAGLGTPAAAAPDEGTILRAGGPSAIADSYIVVLKDAAVARDGVSDRAGRLAGRHGGTVARTYHSALRGFEVRLPAAAARRLAADPAVRYVQQNHTVRTATTQSPTPSWGLDRIDQRDPPLNNSYTYPNAGSGVKAYILDTGIHFTHGDFGGRAVRGFDAVNGGPATDCHGHGTHVAGTVGGAAHGVAKSVSLVAVRVIDCTGEGTFAQVIAGIDWVTGDHRPGQPAVANMSLGGGFDRATNDAVAASIADGVVYAVAAGNGTGNDACVYSPASAPDAITVGAIRSGDALADYSSTGPCLDLLAPGTSITSAWHEHDLATETLSGTSMATPHVAGVAAVILASDPTLNPRQVRDKLVGDATDAVVTGVPAGTPDRLLHLPPNQDFSLVADTAAATVTLGGSMTATVSTTTSVGAPHPVALSATGLPIGATATFNPPSVTSGGSSTLTISTATGSTAHGAYQVRITGTGPETTRTVTVSLTVQGPPGCVQTSSADVSVPDLSTVESVVIVSGCTGDAAADSAVEVHIVHPWRSDLMVTLVTPDGSAHVLHDTTGGGIGNVDMTYVVNLAGEVANGTWRLQLRDVTRPDTGHLVSWTLNLRPSPPPTPTPPPTPAPGTCPGTNGTDVTIPTRSTVESRITVSGCSGNASAQGTVEVHIVHDWLPALVVTLVAPDGSTYPLHSGPLDGSRNIDRRYPVNLAGERRNGTWRLRVQSVMPLGAGYLDNWTLIL